MPRGYVHVIANLRGTGGSGGTFGFFDGQERRDMHDLVEWAAAQPWCDGNVGMIGISYFAMTQLEAAVERPPHLKAIFPVAVTADLYEGASHHGLVSSSFVTPFRRMVGMTSQRSDKLLAQPAVDSCCAEVLHTPPLHRKFATMNGEASLDDAAPAAQAAARSASVGRPLARHRGQAPARDDWWDERNLNPLLEGDRRPGLPRMRLGERAAAPAVHL